jgi:hypothetical protein
MAIPTKIRASMKLNNLALKFLLLASLLLVTIPARSDEPKNHDFDVIYGEARVPAYQLPPLLVSSEGKAITTPEEWFNIRRPQILSLFGNLLYEIIPAPESPIRTTFEVVKTDRELMDHLETDKDIDAAKTTIMGHSKCGKAALWTAAQDQRVALVIAAQSGHPGAALNRRKYGETLEKMVTRFLYWLCLNARQYVNNEDDLPVDQHMLLACIAPRPLYVMSGVEDAWADPRGEYLSAYHASTVYRLLGKKGLESEPSPPVGEAIIQSDVGYHIREGGHSIERSDWVRFLAFAEYHFR